MGIVVIAAALVEIITIVQYERIRRITLEEMNLRSRVVLVSLSEVLEHTLELTEATMRENLWDVKRSLIHPDSIGTAMRRLIDDNPHVVGGCLAFTPYYYPSVGRLYEPYASKNEKGEIEVNQIAGPDHDYTLNGEFSWVVDNELPSWTDPYIYGEDSLYYATYSFPVKDKYGQLAAVCGLDIDLTWLGDTLNHRQPFESSYCMLLTKEGEFVAGPSKGHIPSAEVERAVAVLKGDLPESAYPGISIRKTELEREPYWQLVQVYKTDEVLSKMRHQRRQQMWFIILGLAFLAFVIHQYFKNEKKLLKASEEQARISGELAVAQNIQREMLPKTFPSIVYGSLEPAREVGGDLFDFFTRDGKLFFCIGDVSGKGVPSAMLMSMVHSIFRMITQKFESPSVILKTLNRELCRGNDTCMFMSFFVGILDLYSGELNFGNAGHDKPFLLTDDISVLPVKANLPLGVFPDTHFDEQSCTLAPGSTLMLYTDGLTEAMNLERKEFGRDGVMRVLRSYLSADDKSLEGLVSSMCQAAHDFAGEAPQSDDLTLLALRFDPENTICRELTLSNDTAEVSRMSDFVKDFFAGLEIDKKTAAGIRLALEEAVVNVIDYAYPDGEKGEVLIQADSNHKEVRFTIIDSGIPFDPTSMLEPDTTLDAQNRPIGGLGILLSRRLMDSISYSRKDGQNVLSLTKTIL